MPGSFKARAAPSSSRNDKRTLGIVASRTIEVRSVHGVLIFMAFALSAFNGFMSLLAPLGFCYRFASTMQRLSIYPPAALWIAAVICFWLPRSGFVAYVIILGASILLCIDPTVSGNICYTVYQCFSDLRFAIYGGALLLVSLLIPRKT